MGLLRLAPAIQQHILSMPDMVQRPSITERALRRLTRLEQLGAQLQTFQQLVGQHSAQFASPHPRRARGVVVTAGENTMGVETEGFCKNFWELGSSH